MNQNQVELTWSNKADNEIDYFTVERSLNGRQWEVLTKMEGTGNTDRTFVYQAIDVAPYEGASFYRLGQTDYEGVVTLSPNVEVVYEVSMDQFFMSQEKAVTKMRKNY
jgi:hypothetical protein